MKRTLAKSFLAGAAVACPTVGLAQISIPAMTVSSVQVDFESMVPGSRVDVATINAAYPGANFRDIQAIPPLTAVGNYSVGFALNRALALDPAGSGVLYIVDPGGDFGGSNGYSFTLSIVSTQIGLSVADWVSDKGVEFYLFGSLVGSTTVSGASPVTVQFYEMAGGFDRVDIVGTPNFVIPEIWVESGRVVCYPDCDTSTGTGVLDVFDFLCFQNSFVAGDTYACDCDTSTGSLVCDIFDFLCFQDAFVAGCP